MEKPVSARVIPDSSVPYLQAVGFVSLRFQSPPLPPVPVARPAGNGPPLPSTAGSPPPDKDTTAAAPTPEHPAPETLSPEVISPPEATTPPAAKPARAVSPPILPDETRPRVQAEDFLPFFQFPGSPTPGDVQLIGPIHTAPTTPDHPPPSSATYRQK